MLTDNYKLILIILLLAVSGNPVASDLEKEQRWADQIVDGIMVGEAVWLNDGATDFLTLYTENIADEEIGGAIIAHGIGVHPNWPDVVHPLRSQLAELGWHTLSIQMPILPNEAEYKQYAPLFGEIAPRIAAAEKFLKEKGVKNIVVVAHSMGATMAAYYLANNKTETKALAAIGGTGSLFKVDKLNFLASLEKLSIPVLDIFGGEDLKEVMESAKAKADIANKAGKKNFRQIKVKGANHFFAGKEEQLVKDVNDWLVQAIKNNNP